MWTPIQNYTPIPGKTMLLCVQYGKGRFPVLAYYIEENTVSLDDENFFDEGYDLDMEFAPAGWYEINTATDEHHLIEDEITHVMDVPEFPLLSVQIETQEPF